MVLGTEQLHNFSSRCLMPGALHWSSDSAERHNINSLKGRSSGLKGWTWERLKGWKGEKCQTPSEVIKFIICVWRETYGIIYLRQWCWGCHCIVEWRVIFWAVLTRNSDPRCCRPGIHINLNPYKSMKTKNPAPSSSPKETKASWWFQPIWKKCSSNWVHLPQKGMNKQTRFETTTKMTFMDQFKSLRKKWSPLAETPFFGGTKSPKTNFLLPRLFAQDFAPVIRDRSSSWCRHVRVKTTAVSRNGNPSTGMEWPVMIVA